MMILRFQSNPPPPGSKIGVAQSSYDRTNLPGNPMPEQDTSQPDMNPSRLLPGLTKFEVKQITQKKTFRHQNIALPPSSTLATPFACLCLLSRFAG